MTQTPQPITQHSTLLPPNGYAVAPVTGLAAGVLATVPFPTNLPRTTVPILLTHCVLANSSPFTLLVTQGANITQIPPFTADDVHVMEKGQLASITVLPQATGATVASGVDTSIYATWYDTDPPGVYPCAMGSGSIPLTQVTQLVDQRATAVGTINTAITVPGWVQGLMVRFDDDGTSTCKGFFVTITDTATGTTIITGYVQGLSQPSFFPVGGRSVTVNMSTLNAGGGIGGVFSGRMIVSGLAGPITVLTLGNTTTTVPFAVGTGFVATATVVGSGSQLLVSPPALGYVVKVKTVWYTFTTAAPAATQTVFLRGNNSAINYGRWIADVAAFTPRATEQWNMYIGANPTLATTEGLNAVNNNTGTMQMVIGYDIVPIPWGVNDQ